MMRDVDAAKKDTYLAELGLQCEPRRTHGLVTGITGGPYPRSLQDARRDYAHDVITVEQFEREVEDILRSAEF